MGPQNLLTQDILDLPEVRKSMNTLKSVIVPEPPHWEPPWQTRREALITVVVGEEAEACYRASSLWMKIFAEQHSLDFHVMRWPGHPDWPMSSKFGVARALDYYDRILYVDADVLLPPGCINPLDECPQHSFGAVDEAKSLTPNRRREYKDMHYALGFDDGLANFCARYFNLGVMVVPKCQQHMILRPTLPIAATWCAEQDLVNMRLDAADRHKIGSRTSLPVSCNTQKWTTPGFPHSAPKGSILHWSGHGRHGRAAEMAAYVDGYN